MEEKKIIPESQAGFRSGRSIMDNIYILNHLIQREKAKKSGKDGTIWTLFIDLKAVFDNVDRAKLWDILEEKGINKNLTWRMRKIYEITESSVRGKEGNSKDFRIKKGVRQGCVLSPTLFNVYMADLDHELEKGVLVGFR